MNWIALWTCAIIPIFGCVNGRRCYEDDCLCYEGNFSNISFNFIIVLMCYYLIITTVHTQDLYKLQANLFTKCKSIIAECGCLAQCHESGENTNHCGPVCANYTNYFDCQAKCVNSGGGTPRDCIENSRCRKKCDDKCDSYLPGSRKNGR